MFNALEGKYRVRRGTDCFIQISGSKISSTDGNGNSRCVENTNYYGDTYTESLEATGTLSDGKIKGTLTLSEEWSYVEWGCLYEVNCTYTYDGTSLKQKGASVSGRFESLAGDWNANIAYRTDCTWSVSHATVAKTCEDEIETGGEYEEKKLVAEGKISGDRMDIVYQEQNSNYDQLLVIEVQDDDSLYVDNHYVEYDVQ